MKIFGWVFACFFYASFLFSKPVTVTVTGTGVTGLWSAYSVCKELEKEGLENATLNLVGRWDWDSFLEESSSLNTVIFSHEASGFGPIGIQPHSGLVWNTDNEVVGLVERGIGVPSASFYTSEVLDEEGKEFLELYVGWHARHQDAENDPGSSFRRQEALVAVNRYARGIWGKFNTFGEDNPLDLYLEGAWRIYDNPLQFEAVLKSLEILEKFGYGAEVVYDTKELARRVPFYKKIILETGAQGVFFKDDGFLDSNKLRRFLRDYLLQEGKGKTRVVLYQDSAVVDLIRDEEGNCSGVRLANGKEIQSDVTILSMGLENKNILRRYQIELPLWNVWGAAVKAPLNPESETPPNGGVSFHTQRCLTASPDKKNITIAGISMVLSEGEEPHPGLYVEKITKSLADIFKDRVDMSSLQFRIAPGTGIPDDLPIIGLDVSGIANLIVLNPTSHLGNTQSIGLGKIAALRTLEILGKDVEYPEGLPLHSYRLDRFRNDVEKVRSDRENNKFVLKWQGN